MSFTSSLTGGLIGDAPDYAKFANRSEKRRQGIINLGLNQINSVFDGGSAPFYSLAAKTPFSKGEWNAGANHNTYYTLGKGGNFIPYYAPNLKDKGRGTYEGALTGLQAGSVVPGIGNVVGASLGGVIGGTASGDYGGALLSAGSGGMSALLGGLFGGGPPSPRDLVNKQIKRGLLFNAPQEKTFTGFDDNFYNARQKAYLDYALPQLGDQYTAAKNAALYSLSNRGLLGSTVQSAANRDIERTSGQARQAAADEALSQVNDTKRQVNEAKQNVINQLYQSADPSRAFQSAISTASQFQAPSTFAPLANAFGNIYQNYVNDNLLRKYGSSLGGNPYQGDNGIGNFLAPI